jgi:hypothetical protein
LSGAILFMKSLLAIILSLLMFVPHTENDDWMLVKHKGDIKVYVRQQEKGAIKEVKILTQYNCSMHELVASLEDVNAHKEWVMNTIESKVIETIQPWEFYYYISTDMPFPIKDRDLVIYYSRRQDTETGTVYTKSTASPNKHPLIDDFIRITSFESSYTLTPGPDEIIYIEYRMKVDPGGFLPSWLVNLAVTKGPLDTIESLFELLASKKYQNAYVAAITDY